MASRLALTYQTHFFPLLPVWTRRKVHIEHKSTDERESRPTLDKKPQTLSLIVKLTAICLFHLQLERRYDSEVFYYLTSVLLRTSTWALLVSSMESMKLVNLPKLGSDDTTYFYRHHLLLSFLFLYEMAPFYIKSQILSCFIWIMSLNISYCICVKIFFTENQQQERICFETNRLYDYHLQEYGWK